MKKRSLTLYLTRGAAVSALYVALTFISSLVGLSSGVIQLRLSEALCILPLFLPEAIPGLFVGCMIANLVSGAVFWDIIFGSLATLIGAVGARVMRRLPERLKWLATLPTVVSNSLIVPPVLIYAYGVPEGYLFITVTVAVGEILSATLFGSLLYYKIKKSDLIKRIG